MIGIYFSGTGNTRFCVEHFLQLYDAPFKAYSIEEACCREQIEAADEILFAYPIYYSNLPKIVREFILENRALWKGKKIFILATMGLFSGDGTGCSARLFRKFGAKVTGGLHLKMPDCIADVKLLKKSTDQNRNIIERAEDKIKKTVQLLRAGKKIREGLRFSSHIAGLFGQRLWFYGKTKKYFSGVKVDAKNCIGCGLCAASCPMHNLKLVNAILIQEGRCTMCYRCVNRCPKQAITLLGKKVTQQCGIENYI